MIYATLSGSAVLKSIPPNFSASFSIGIPLLSAKSFSSFEYIKVETSLYIISSIISTLFPLQNKTMDSSYLNRSYGTAGITLPKSYHKKYGSPLVS